MTDLEKAVQARDWFKVQADKAADRLRKAIRDTDFLAKELDLVDNENRVLRRELSLLKDAIKESGGPRW